MADYQTYYEMTMESEGQINKAVNILEIAIKASKEDNDTIGQFSAFLEELKNNISGNSILLSQSFEISLYAFNVLFPDWFKAIAKELPDSSFKAEAFQEAYNDGSSVEYKVTYKKGILNMKNRLKGYDFVGCEPKYEGVLNSFELTDFMFELNGIKEHEELKPKERIKPGLTIKNGVLKACLGDLTDFVVPDDITAIGARAFCKCSKLQSIFISANVVKIANDAFAECENLEEITVAEENDVFISINNCIIKKSNRKLIAGCKTSVLPTDGSLKTIGANAFSAGQPTSIFIPKSVTKIEDDAFSCIGLKEIVVEKGNRAYHSAGNCLIDTKSKILLLGCENSVIPNDGSVIEIDNSAFAGCDITEIVIPDSVQNLGRSYYRGAPVFEGCSRLTSVDVGNGVISIGCNAFNGCERLTNFIIGGNVTSINRFAFDGCKNLQFNEYDNALYLGNQNNPYVALIKVKDKSIISCTINDRTKIIADSAFDYCIQLTNVTIGKSVTSIGGYAFCKCENLESITIPNSVTSIGREAFRRCENLKSITIPNSVTCIGHDVFRECENLKSINIPNSVTSIGLDIFDGCKNLKSIILQEGVTKIWERAFSGCENLEGITIPNSVTSIGGYAFCKCENLESITIPNSVTSIGREAFHGCKNLKSITIPNSVTSIGRDAFDWCDNLTIYCVIEEQPNGWEANWNSGRPVIWGYKEN